MVSVVELTLCVLNRSRFSRIWNAIQDFDESFDLGMKNGKLDPLLRQSKIWLWSLFFGSVLSWVAVNQTGMYAFGETYFRNVAYMLTYIGSCVAVLKFTGLAALLGQRFFYLNLLVPNADGEETVKVCIVFFLFYSSFLRKTPVMLGWC